MKNKKFASFLAAAAALVLLAMPAFAADEQTELPAAEAAEVQQEQTAAPAEQETALPADAQTAGEPEQQLTYVALGDSITSGVGLADMKYNIAQIGCSRTLRATLPNATPPLWARALGWTASTPSIWACPA